MKSLKLTGVVILLAAFTLTSCIEETFGVKGEGPIVTETLFIDSIDKIDLAGATDITISYGAVQEVQAVGHANIIDRVKRTVTGGEWTASLERGNYRNYKLEYFVTLPSLTNIKLSGSGDIVIDDFMDQELLGIQITGSGDIEINKFEGAQEVSINISGSGDITAYENISTLQELEINISGSGGFAGYSLATDDCFVNISGSGDCKVFANELLDVNISGSGDVRYKGNPELKTKISASGSVINAN